MNKPLSIRLTLALAATLSTPALAEQSQADHDHSAPEGMAQHMQMMQGMNASAPAAAAPSGAQSEHQTFGVVRKIDLANGKITLRHGPIPALGMGAMTMNYRVRDKALLDGLKAGDTVEFSAKQIDGAYTVTSLKRKP